MKTNFLWAISKCGVKYFEQSAMDLRLWLLRAHYSWISWLMVMHLLQSLLCLACFYETKFLCYFQMRSEILWAAPYGSLFATHQSTKQLNFVADGCIWMSDFALAKVSVFSNLPIVFSEMVLCFIFPTSRDLHANTFRELSEVYADLIRHAGFHFPTTGNFTLCL